jgi:hypothetical protein
MKISRLWRWTTVGRFWGYVSVLVALSVSLAGNVTAAYLHRNPLTHELVDPTWVDIGFAGIPPLVAFFSIETVNHNVWDGIATPWGPMVRKVILGLVTPASAIVSFIHLVTVVVTDRLGGTREEDALVWFTAVLTALLIDGMMFGGVAALLLPKGPASAAAPEPSVAVVTMDADEPVLLADPEGRPALPARKRTVRATLAKQVPLEEKDRKRWPPRQHPLWEGWVSARTAGAPWSAEDMALKEKAHMDREMSVPAAQTRISRWEKELSTST